MRATLILIFCIAAAVNADVKFSHTWPAGRGNFAGARGNFKFSNLYFGTCTILLPHAVVMFFGENFDIVPSKSDRQRGKYVISAPYHEYDENNFDFVINFYPRQSFRGNEVEWTCDPSQEATIGVGSFPSDITNSEAFSHIWFPKLRRKSEITLFFPGPVADFMAYGVGNIVKRGMHMYTLSGFYWGQDEVWFQFRYMTRRKFDASEVIVKEQYYGY